MEIPDSSRMDKSDIIPIRDIKSEMSERELGQKAGSKMLKAYNNTRINPDFVNRFNPNMKKIELSSEGSSLYPMLNEKFKNFDQDQLQKIQMKMG